MHTDKYIYRRVLSGIQTFLPVHMLAYTQTTSSLVREKIKSFLLEEIGLFDNFFEYGKLKGWISAPPLPGLNNANKSPAACCIATAAGALIYFSIYPET